MNFSAVSTTSFTIMASASLIPRYLIACVAAFICGPLVPVATLYIALLSIPILLIFPVLFILSLGAEGPITIFISLAIVIFHEMRHTILANIVFSFGALPMIHLAMRRIPNIRYFLFPFVGSAVAFILGIIQGLAFFSLLFAFLGGLAAAHVFGLIMRDVEFD